MALQGIWSGTISFSLVAIPVQLVRAVSPGRISFRTLHRSDYSPLARRMFCPRHETLVPADEIVRGYELAPDHYLPISDEELESVSPERSRTIEIVEFVPLEELDPLYFEHPYYLMPLKGGEKAYQLLAEVLQQTGKAGLAKFVLAEREYLVAVKSTAGALTLITLHYSEDVLSADTGAPPESAGAPDAKKRIKVEIAKRLADFAPEKYADERREKLLALLRQKAQEQAPVEAPAATEDEGPPDLMAALEAAMRDVRQKR